MTDHHQFVLWDWAQADFADVRLPVDDALVVGSEDQIWIITGAYAAPVEVTLALLDGAPPQPNEAWEDVVELSVRSSGGFVVAELFNGPKTKLPSAPGWYRLRVCARGRDGGEERGEVGRSAKVVEHVLIQAWPAPPEDGVTIRGTTLQPVDHTAGREHLQPARAAAARIAADLSRLSGRGPKGQGRQLSGQTGSVEVEWAYPATRRKLFLYAAFPCFLTSASRSNDPDPVPGAQYRMEHNEYRDIWDGIPTGPDNTWIQVVIRSIDTPYGSCLIGLGSQEGTTGTANRCSKPPSPSTSSRVALPMARH